MVRYFKERQVVNFVRPNRFEAILPDRFEYGHGRFRWIQRLCFRLLRWCKAQAVEMGVRYESLPRPKIDKWILEHEGYILCDYHQRVDVLLVGPNQFDDLAMFCFEVLRATFPYSGVDVGGPGQPSMIYRGLRIYVIPWMDGILALPSDKFHLLKFWEPAT